jgi:hypothetical protein
MLPNISSYVQHSYFVIVSCKHFLGYTYALPVYIVTNFLLFIVIKVIDEYNFQLYLINCTNTPFYDERNLVINAFQ